GESLVAGIEAIPDTANRLDQPRVRRISFDLRAQPLDGDVDEARVAEVVVVPDELEQELASEHLFRPARELQQEPELRCGQLEVLPLAPDAERGRVDLEAVDRDHAFR